MKKPYVHSNFERIKDDNYQTIDPRCVHALIQSVPILLTDRVVDCCANRGSGIIGELCRIGYRDSICVPDAFSDFACDWIISNPPYTRGLVDKIIWAQIQNLQKSVFGVAMLLRNNFDFAKGRYEMFTHSKYWGQIHMMFRPWWSEEKKHQPIHNYVWHIWRDDNEGEPIVRYWKEEK